LLPPPHGILSLRKYVLVLRRGDSRPRTKVREKRRKIERNERKREKRELNIIKIFTSLLQCHHTFRMAL